MSARDVSKFSQIKRMGKVLTENNLFKYGQILKFTKDQALPNDVLIKISGIADYIFSHKHEFSGYTNRYKFFKESNITYISKWERKSDNNVVRDGRFNLNFRTNNNSQIIDVQQIDFYMPHFSASKHEVKSRGGDGGIMLSSLLEGNVMTVYWNGQDNFSKDLSESVDKIVMEYGAGDNQDTVKSRFNLGESYELKLSNKDISININSIGGEMINNIPEINYISGKAFVNLR